MATTFRTLYPGRPDIRIVPEVLRPLRGVESGNRVVSLPGDVRLFIRSKSHPGKFIMRTVSAIPGLRTAPVEKEIEFSSGQTALDDTCWQAVYLVRAETMLRATRDEFIIR